MLKVIKMRWISVLYVFIAYLTSVLNSSIEEYRHRVLTHDKQPLINDVVRRCELESLSVGTRLADHYGSFDENTEWDIRLHHDYLVQYLGRYFCMNFLNVYISDEDDDDNNNNNFDES